MIKELDFIVKKAARKSLYNLIIANICTLPIWFFVILQIILETPVIVYPFAIFIQFLTVPYSVRIIKLMIYPNSKKKIKKFCKKTKDPKATFAELEKTWQSVELLELELKTRSNKIKKLIESTNVFLGNEHIIGVIGNFIPKIKIIPLKSAVWIYSDKPKDLYIHFLDGGLYKRKKI